MAGKPLISAVLLIIAGVIILAAGIHTIGAVNVLNSSAFRANNTYNSTLFAGASTVIDISAGIGIVCGIILMISGIAAYVYSNKIKLIGIVALIFSLVSLLNGGGYLIGFIVGLAGSILAIVYKPVTK